jgi:hypothetical protein
MIMTQKTILVATQVILMITLSLCTGRSVARADLSFNVVDTGQNTCFDDTGEISPPDPGEPFYGQDAQYDGHQPSYTISGDGLTVYDNVTGLTWTRDADLDGDGDIDADDKRTFDQAPLYADTLNAQNFGGYSDWRVPTIKELYSLIDFRGRDTMADDPAGQVPFIDTTYFAFAYGDIAAGERLIDSQWVTSTLYLDTVMGGDQAMFGVNFADGRIKGYGLMGMGDEKTFYVRLCRGNPDYGINDLTDNGDGTVTDHATGLMWSQDDFGGGTGTGPRSGMIWEDALALVEQKNDESYLGYSDWRLPNAKEMESIVDYSRAPGATGSAAIDTVFNITQITNEDGQIDYPWYWTGTTHARIDGSGEAGAYVCFGRGMGYWNSQWEDVHGAGCQRSDQKNGDFTGYTYMSDGYYFGMAPQDDAVRMYNYVRLVRDDSVPPETIDDLQIDLVGADLLLTWSAVTSDTNQDGIDVDLYYIYRDTVSGFDAGSEPFDSTATTYYEDASGTIGDAGVQYYYSVTALCAGKESGFSQPVGEFDRSLSNEK